VNGPAVTRQQKHRQKRRAAGLCGYEGCPNQAGSYYCEPCRLHRSTTWKRWYATNKDRLKNARVIRDMVGGDGEEG